MVQARILLAAIVLTVTVPSASEARSFPCWMVRAYYYSHTPAQREAAAKEHTVTRDERREHSKCLKDKK